MQDYNLFPTLVRRIKNFLSKDEIDLILAYKPNLALHGALSGNAVSSHSVKSVLLNDIDHIVSLNKRIYKIINEFRLEYGIIKLGIDNSWINIQEPDSRLNFHTHPDSVISGAIYVNVDDDSSKLYFYNPNPYLEYINYFNAPETHTYLNYKTIYLKPNNGDLILFPSWLRHGSEDLNKTIGRVVISFNTKYEQ
jgi:uncharacterized protein (TIGR02466 family)